MQGGPWYNWGGSSPWLTPLTSGAKMKLVLHSASKLFAVTVIWSATSCCFATVLYDNLANAMSGPDSIQGPAARGISFNTDSSTYNSLTATLLMYSLKPAGPATLTLYSDVSSTIGSPLGVFTSPGSFAFLGVVAPATFTLSGVNLSPSTAYWLVLQDLGTGALFWSFTTNGSGTGPGFTAKEVKTNDGGATWSYFSGQPNQAQIVASVVPEPSAFYIAAIGVSLIGIYRKKIVRRVAGVERSEPPAA